MNNLGRVDDIALFVRVVNAGGLAAAGRQLGLSPASMTARVNALEARYNTRLLQRTTRSISVTEAGKRFYDACVRVLDELDHAESLLKGGDSHLSGRLRITAPSDFGRQFVAPAILQFVRLHPGITPYLELSDNISNLVENSFDLGIHLGNLPDSTLIVSSLADNRRVLVASPSYLNKYGAPRHPEALLDHHCLVLERHGEPLKNWKFLEGNNKQVVSVPVSLSSNDGAVLRQWALDGFGIAMKSFWDVKNDLREGRLQSILEEFVLGFQPGDESKIGLQLVYPNRKYVPIQVEKFIEFFKLTLLRE